jgi:hypothetical protein
MAGDGYGAARHEHAWLLRAEGETYAEIGRRLGVSRDRAGQMVRAFGKRVLRAMRRTTFYGDDACADVLFRQLRRSLA